MWHHNAMIFIQFFGTLYNISIYLYVFLSNVPVSNSYYLAFNNMIVEIIALTQTQDEKFFLIHCLQCWRLSYIIVQELLYGYFPDNWRFQKGVILYLDKYGN
jgi:hypothetical protein